MFDMKMKRSYFLVGSVLLVLILIAAGMYWRYEVEPALLLKKVREDQMVTIEEGVCRFDEKNGHLPTNMIETVNAGFLPKRSNVYACALKYETFQPPEIGFEDSDYLLIGTLDEVVVLVKPEVVQMIKQNPRYSHISSRLFSKSIISGQRTFRTKGK